MSERQFGGTIRLDRYDTEWVAMFAHIARQIRDALGPAALAIEHVGSTSIPGLSAKPVIDVALVVADSADEAAYLPALETVGIVLQFREPDWFEHRLLRAPEIASNIHVFSDGCDEVDRMLLFRDWLRKHDDDRRLYGRTKHDLAQREWQRVQDYADAKSRVVQEILARATAGRSN